MSQSCRYCNTPVTAGDAAITHSYWSAVEDVAHRECVIEGRKSEAYACQLIDADCNDCKHFRRGPRALYHGDKVKGEEGEYVRIFVQKDIFHGHCLRFDRITMAFVNFATGRPCFEHRRAE